MATSMRTNIVITGASSGLGAGMARAFAAKGRNVALCARRIDLLWQLRDELLRAHPGIDVAVYELDVNNHDRVFTVFRAYQARAGSVDRVIVNAGLGKGQPIGIGRFDTNLQTAQTNFTAALAQCEAAMEIFRAQNDGHLVAISSMRAMRGLPGELTTYAASKAGLAALAEGIRADTLDTPIRVTTIYPGYIATAMSATSTSAPMLTPLDKGVRAMVNAVEREPAEATVPSWPWTPIGFVRRHAPLRLLGRSS
ncbi:SDR family oxidoreductase [Nocardia sp. NPDC056611]|uniref:SDR family oxidoreductase n=1 Tax=Nocardia sp. NPDC056611 TaxID=3345877 RepID=UPI00366C85C0